MLYVIKVNLICLLNICKYLDKFTDGTKGNAVSNARIFMESEDGHLEEIRRIEVQESTIIGQPSIRVVLKGTSDKKIISKTFNQT